MGQKTQDEIVVGISSPHPHSYLEFAEELSKLGYKLIDCSDTEWGNKRLDICILSLDIIKSPSPAVLSNLEIYDIPFIISLNDDAVMENLSEHLQKAVGFLFAEPSLHHLALEIEVGLHIHRERTLHSRRVEHVSTKIQNNRDIGMATGLLMGQTHLSALQVFSVLKTFSRNARIRIATLANEVIRLYEQKHPELSHDKKIIDLESWLATQVQVDELTAMAAKQSRKVS